MSTKRNEKLFEWVASILLELSDLLFNSLQYFSASHQFFYRRNVY
jgi:hypothetical protein